MRRPLGAGMVALVLLTFGCGGSGRAAVPLPPHVAGTGAGRAPRSDPRGHDEAIAVSWVGRAGGWLLVGAACRQGPDRCAVVYRTSDTGRSWVRSAALPARIAGLPGITARPGRLPVVSGLVFATSKVGYAYGPSLLMTRDDGRSWRRIPSRTVESMSATGGTAYRLVADHGGCPGWCRVELQRSTDGSIWRSVSGWRDLTQGFGEQVLAAGPNVYTVFYGHIAGGLSSHATLEVSRDGGVTWVVRSDPCGHRGSAEMDTATASAAGSRLAVLCVSKGGGQRPFAAVSPDAGRRFASTPPSCIQPNLIAVSPNGWVAVATGGMEGSGRIDYRVALRAPGGRWTVAVHDPEPVPPVATPGVLAFATDRDLVWAGSPQFVWRSRDAGATWRRAPTP